MYNPSNLRQNDDIPEGDGYLAALINFRFIANDLWTTDDAVANISAAR